jgi:type IV secretion system protein TrbE
MGVFEEPRAFSGTSSRPSRRGEKHNAAMVLSTQSLDELKRSDILDVIIESCPTKIFLANPDMDRDLYRRQFHLNENEVELISASSPSSNS